MSQLYFGGNWQAIFSKGFLSFFLCCPDTKNQARSLRDFCSERSEGALIATKLRRDRPPKSVKIQIIVLTRDSN